MSLEESFYELVGAGLMACATGLDLHVPPGAVASGDAFIGYLSQRGEWGETNRIVEEMRRDAVLDRDARGISFDAAEYNARALARVLESCRPASDQVRQALHSPVPGGSEQSAGQDSWGGRIAGDVVQRAARAGVLQSSRMREDVSFMLLERLFGRVLQTPAFVIGLHGAFEEYLATTFPPSVAVPVAAAASSAHASGPAGAELRPPVLASPAPGDDSKVARVAADYRVSSRFAGRLAQPGVLERVDAIKLRRRLGDGVFLRFLSLLDAQNIGERELPGRLEEMAGWLETLREALLRPSNEEAEIRRLKADAAAALAGGDFESAVQLLKHVRKLVRDGRRRIEERLREDVMSLDAQMKEEATATGRLAEMELARGDHAAAAELFAEARDSLPRSDRQAIWLYSMRQAEALFRLGEKDADQVAFMESARTYGAALEMIPLSEAPKNWVAAQCGLGLALARLGERSGEVVHLAEAAGAWRKALDVPVALDEPQRTMTRLHLARAVGLLGERDAGRGWAAQAAELWRAALDEPVCQQAPGDWAEAQLGLGAALLMLEEQEPGSDGGARLSEAITALRQALTVYTRQSASLEWAMAQLHLGTALLTVGERDGRHERLGEAVRAFHDALQVFTRAATPSQWATAKTGLASAHATLGERQGDESGFVAAAAAYAEALTAIDMMARPMDWAIAQLNLGAVLVRLGERGDPGRHWSSAADAITAALVQFESQGADDYAEIARRNLDNLQRARARRPRDQAQVS